MSNITRREWMKHIFGTVADTAALIIALLDDWDEMPDADKQEAVEAIKGKIDTILTMIKGRHIF